MDLEELATIAKSIVASGKGILAADESSGTIKSSFDTINVESTEENRLSYREMLFRTKGASEFISGVILYDETLRQRSGIDGTPIVQVLQDQGIIPGIKVDKSTNPLSGSNGELITDGLDGLRGRLKEYYELGARFTKWRAVIKIGADIPSSYCITTNAHLLARFAKLSQEANLVPIVEPEVLMDGTHSIEKCHEVSNKTLNIVFEQLNNFNIMLEGIVLKPNMVISGLGCNEQADVEKVSELTVQCLKSNVPESVPGIAFLSGGQTAEEATEHLDLMNKVGDLPWELSFSYGRALQAPTLSAWQGNEDNFSSGQEALLKRARLNGLAHYGQYDVSMETED